MRSTLFSVTLTMAVLGGLPAAHADEGEPFSSAPILRAQDSVAGDDFGSDDAGVTDVSSFAADSFVTPDHWFDSPQYGAYFQADALWLARVHQVDRPLVVTLTPASKTVLSSQDADITDNFRVGMLLTLGFRFDQISAVEFTYFGLNEWHNNAIVTSPAPAPVLALPGTLPTVTQDFVFANQVAYDYGASIQNAEANYKQTIEGLTLLGGFRWFALNERANLNSHILKPPEASDYHVTALNRLVGLQAGAGYDWFWRRLNVNILGKIGVFANLASQETLLQDVGNSTTLRDYKTQTTPVSVLGEIALNARYQVTDWFAFRAGYRLIGVNNLAVAPDQFDFSAPAIGRVQPVAAHEFLVLHGFNVGGEVRW
jgi:hypothetical protein